MTKQQEKELYRHQNSTDVQKTEIQLTKPSKNMTSIQTVFRQKLHAMCHSNKQWIKVTLLALNVQINNVLKHDRNRVYSAAEWCQWRQSHVIHCRCNICCKINYSAATWIVNNYVIRTKLRFLTVPNQTLSKSNPSFFSKTERKPNRNKKSILHVFTEH